MEFSKRLWATEFLWHHLIHFSVPCISCKLVVKAIRLIQSRLGHFGKNNLYKFLGTSIIRQNILVYLLVILTAPDDQCLDSVFVNQGLQKWWYLSSIILPYLEYFYNEKLSLINYSTILKCSLYHREKGLIHSLYLTVSNNEVVL